MARGSNTKLTSCLITMLPRRELSYFCFVDESRGVLIANRRWRSWASPSFAIGRVLLGRRGTNDQDVWAVAWGHEGARLTEARPLTLFERNNER